MVQRPGTLPRRGLGDLLNETFVIYARHVWKLIFLTALLEVPLGLLALVELGWWAQYVGIGLATILGSLAVYGAVVYAVGQHYLVGRLDVGGCYRRVWWRGLSLVALGLVFAALAGGLFGVALVAERSPLAVLALLLVIVPVVALTVYWSAAVQAVVMEGRGPARALRRSAELVRGSWWRVGGINLVLLLAALGLGIILQVPFAILSRAVAPEEATTLSQAVDLVGGILVGVAVPPVLAIGETLLYYDLRVRKENYDFSTLSREMGLAMA